MDNRYIPLIQDFLQYVEDNIKNRHAILKHAEELTEDCKWFPMVFHVVVGMSVEDYTIARVMAQASRAIVRGVRTVTSIGKDYKFTSQQSFSTTFANVVGVPPHIFRIEKPYDKLVKPFVLDLKSLGLEGLNTSGVRIVEVPAMNVASTYMYKSNSRQSKIKVTRDILEPRAWSKLLRWNMINAYHFLLGYDLEKAPGIAKISKFLVSQNYHLAPYSRYFGFSTPLPSNGKEVGYEAWSMIYDNGKQPTSEEKDIIIKRFEGGLYAAIDVPDGFDGDIRAYWRIIHCWILESKEYTYGDHQHLEEYLTIRDKGGFHGKILYLPIKKITE